MKDFGSSRPAIADSIDLIPVARCSLDLEELRRVIARSCYQQRMDLQPDGSADWTFVSQSWCFEDGQCKTSRRMAALHFQPTLAGALSLAAVR
jgi:hypothetical protein